MDNAGNLLPPDNIGEIVIRGENVTAGYENNPKANAEAYTHGWFRTGDQGHADDGRLSDADRSPQGNHQPGGGKNFSAGS
jgi:acyl-CoA synthetase (AMP-forming)/AMP-acid ligase II